MLSRIEVFVLAPIGFGTVDVTVKATDGASASSSTDRFTDVR